MQIKEIITLSLVLVVVLTMAAFGSNGLKDLYNTTIMGAQAAGDTNQPATFTVSASGSASGMAVATGGPDGQFMMINFIPAPELPTRAPDAGGQFSSFDGTTLTLVNNFFASAGGFATGATITYSGSVVTVPADSLNIVPLEPGQGIESVATGSAEALPVVPEGATITYSGSMVTVPAEMAGTITTGAPGTPGEGVVAIMVGPSMPGTGMPPATPQNVVVTEQTKIYHDVTPMPAPGVEVQQTIRQTLEAGSLEGLDGTVMVTVWGHMEGDTLVADVIVYQSPMMVEVK